MNDPRTINRIKRVIERKFSYYPKTKEVLDLKEELMSIVLDKYNDLTTGSEQQKYKECMSVMMSSYKQVLHDLEIESSKKILMDKILGFSIFGTLYFLIVVATYILISLFVVKSFKETYFIVLAPTILFTFLVSLFIFKYSQKMNFKVLTRVFLGVSFLTFGISLYTIPCFYLMIYKGINIWHPMWLIFLIDGTIYLFVDRIIYPSHKPVVRLVRNALNLLALFTTVYLIVSIFTHSWYVTWLIYIFYVVSIEINILLFFKRKL